MPKCAVDAKSRFLLLYENPEYRQYTQEPEGECRSDDNIEHGGMGVDEREREREMDST